MMAPLIHSAGSIAQVLLINLILSGDNAVVIALTARNLPAHQRRRAIFWGGISATVVQLGFTLMVAHLIRIPGLQLLGALMLAGIACRLLQDEARAEGEPDAPGALPTALLRIAAANLVMSLDNVIAVAGASRSDPVCLALGLLTSAAILLVFSTIVLKFLERVRWLAFVGAGMLALTAAGMMWQDLRTALTVAHIPAATFGLGLAASRAAHWTFKALVVSTCLSSPRWWPLLPGMRPLPAGAEH